MKPKFTDAHKYPHGYMDSSVTDITKTLDRERARIKKLLSEEARTLAQNESEAQVKVREIKERKRG